MFYRIQFIYTLHIFVSCILVVDTSTLALVGESQHCIELLRITLYCGAGHGTSIGVSTIKSRVLEYLTVNTDKKYAFRFSDD